MAGSDDENPPPPPPQTPTQQAPHTVSTIKLSILKKGEYDIWAMKMEHYLSHTDYPIWEVIQKGNSLVSPLKMQIKSSLDLYLLPGPKMLPLFLLALNEGSSSYTDDLMYSFFANQTSGPQLDHEDLEQVNEFNLEEMDLKWQVAMISMRLGARGGGSDLLYYESWLASAGDDKINVLTYHKKLLAEAVKEKEELKTKLENFQSSSKGLSKLLNSQMSTMDKSGLRSSDVEDSPVHDRFVNVEGMYAVPPPMIGNYMPSGPIEKIDDSKHMTGNKAYLAEYQDYNGGPVSFGGSKGYITGKGGLACLIAKATVDESNKWHRRLAKNEGVKHTKDTGLKTNEEPVNQEDQAFLKELEMLKIQEKEANDAGEVLRKEFESKYNRICFCSSRSSRA
ncbi:hypothetical protein Tco_0859917 [Tanacetum coccineum]|uniref:Uncharacterized protein n=1 Tax=Tanacetum coccineum TaxID=301880 RepID=A0ABQ5BDG0_9ASTR